MKRLLTLLFASFTVLFGKDDIYLGMGPYFQTQPYKDADPVVLASPVIFFDNSLFYIRWTRLGMYFAGEKNGDDAWGLSLTAQPQILGYYETAPFNQIVARESTPILQGMPSRESGWEGGVAAAIEHRDFFAELLILNDILGQSNGLKIRLETGRSFTVGRWYFVPSLLAVWLSQPFADYYYGVSHDNADPALGRTAYRSDAALNIAVQTYIKYSLTDHWHLLANLRADRLADTIYRSPLVGTQRMVSGMISVMYSFNLFGAGKAVLNPPDGK